MKNWIIKEEWFNNQEITANENRFLCGNGYLGIRGALEEFQKEKLPAVNLSGIYDRVGDGWREPLNAPNPLYTRMKVDGEYYFLPEKEPVSHTQELDFKHGLVRRHTTFHTKRGSVTVESEHFASMADCHLIGMRYIVMADFHADLEIQTGIDGDVWDIHGPHYDDVRFEQKDKRILVDAITHEKKTKNEDHFIGSVLSQILISPWSSKKWQQCTRQMIAKIHKVHPKNLLQRVWSLDMKNSGKDI